MSAKTVDETESASVLADSSYEVLKKRLDKQNKQLQLAIAALNDARIDAFGRSEMSVLARLQVRTENNCTARDIVQVGDCLLFGYNVFIGLKKETVVADVFSLYRLSEQEGKFELTAIDSSQTFLADKQFVEDFAELYRFYKNTHLIELTVKNGLLLAGFQIGDRIDDVRVFRWRFSADGAELRYVDNRGERDIALPPRYDFTWVKTTREDQTHGRYPNINIRDKLFISTAKGDLSFKIENNTEIGKGIHNESLAVKEQSLDDSKISYAEIGRLIVIAIEPYGEDESRYFVFDGSRNTIARVDDLGASCQTLPDDHGIIFPGGIFIEENGLKKFDDDTRQLRFKSKHVSPNGEDLLYVFYRQENGDVYLLNYNKIEKQILNPLTGNGYAIFNDGSLVIFSNESEAQRMHPMQIWQTPYSSKELSVTAANSDNKLFAIGNADLVRAISDVKSIARVVEEPGESVAKFTGIVSKTRKLVDDYHWLADEEISQIQSHLDALKGSVDLIIGEYEKVESIKQKSKDSLNQALDESRLIVSSIQTNAFAAVDEFVAVIKQIRHQQGQYSLIKDYRYIDTQKIDDEMTILKDHEDSLMKEMVVFLGQADSLGNYKEALSDIAKNLDEVTTKVQTTALLDRLDNTSLELDLLSEILTAIEVEDAAQKTAVVDDISMIYASINQLKSKCQIKQKSLGYDEAESQFSAQIKLFTQSILSAVGLATTPNKSDQQLTRLVSKLEEMESQFDEYEEFLVLIDEKRNEIYETFENHKLKLEEIEQKKLNKLQASCDRLLSGIDKRIQRFSDRESLVTYFATDPLVAKLEAQIKTLHERGAVIQADALFAKLKAFKDSSLRIIRDKEEMYADGGNVIKLGKIHRFSVNINDPDIVITEREGELFLHITATDYFAKLDDPKLTALKPYWEASDISESDDVYRGEYLTAQVIAESTINQGVQLSDLLNKPDKLAQWVGDYAASCYQEGYIKGIHDHDACKLLQALIPTMASAKTLRFSPSSRAMALLYWAEMQRTNANSDRLTHWASQAKAAALIKEHLGSDSSSRLLVDEIEQGLQTFFQESELPQEVVVVKQAAEYLVAELMSEDKSFLISKHGGAIMAMLKSKVGSKQWSLFNETQRALQNDLPARIATVQGWLEALELDEETHHYAPEAMALWLTADHTTYSVADTKIRISVDGLLGQHSRIKNQQLDFTVDDFLNRVATHKLVAIPQIQAFKKLKQNIVAEQRHMLGVETLKARPLSSFVRNRLINEVYLPLIGDNMAKQMGTIGDDKRTDLMGLLIMISPPGYGKTTLMEYVANRLGLIFMKINGPSLGRHVTSLDSSKAPDSGAQKELEKINMAFEMGNNVMLYLDDIQHTNPEFLQQFISLCDGSRQIQGTWQGRAKNYNLRGKKFSIVMAGNPYTETGEVFKIPDMLANRADIYNLGDIIGGNDEAFAMSYIENCLTSNTTLAALANRSMQDIYLLLDRANDKEISLNDLDHDYSQAEIEEITNVFKRLIELQEVVLTVNKQYIYSASQNEMSRDEPAFKLQGSYRDMNKMAEKITAIMSDAEFTQIIDDHYQGEAQLLSADSEANLLKLAELTNKLTGVEEKRWQHIKANFKRNQTVGDVDVDAGRAVVGQLLDMNQQITAIADVIAQLSADSQQRLMSTEAEDAAKVDQLQAQMHAQFSELSKQIIDTPVNVEVVNQPVPGMDITLKALAHTIENIFVPIVRSMDKKLDIDLRSLEHINNIGAAIKKLREDLALLNQEQ